MRSCKHSRNLIGYMSETRNGKDKMEMNSGAVMPIRGVQGSGNILHGHE